MIQESNDQSIPFIHSFINPSLSLSLSRMHHSINSKREKEKKGKKVKREKEKKAKNNK